MYCTCANVRRLEHRNLPEGALDSRHPVGRGFFILLVFTGWLLLVAPCDADALPLVRSVPRQPFVSSVKRLLEALEFSGNPLPAESKARLDAAFLMTDDRECVSAIQEILDRHCLNGVHINPESRVSVSEGDVEKLLTEQGWRSFLIKVHNEAGVTAEFQLESPNLAPVYEQGRGARQRPRTEQALVEESDLPDRFLDAEMLIREPLKPRLSGLSVEYRVLLLYSRDAGAREALLGFSVGAGSQDLGFRNRIPVLFRCRPAVEVALSLRDFDGTPVTAALRFRDAQGRVYPNPAKRLAPDFFFHHQIYRRDGESIRLPAGSYELTVDRGPEYLQQKRQVVIPDNARHGLAIRLERWIHPAARGWYSGDHHVHAAGCAHYDSPTEGVSPDDMMRHLLGEDLNVGCVLSWGPCWYTQKQYFEGAVSALSRPGYLMRYDVEVSGFPSSHAGHLCLLNLSEDDYPGTEKIEEWPSWTLPVLKWGRRQGGLVGYSHTGWGLALPDYMPDGSRRFVPTRWGGAPNGWAGKAADTLPDYAMPRFDGIGANEYIVAAAAGECDFISTVDTPAAWELNIWYHTLNCGLQTRISGETDFPCIYGDRVGLGRVYVGLPKGTPLSWEAWIQGLKNGRSYCGDGLSHIFDLRVDDAELGVPHSTGRISTLELDEPREVTVSFDAAAWLEPKPTEATESIRQRRLDEKPYWHLERCRLGTSRQVSVEVIVNGNVARAEPLTADGSLQSYRLPLEITESSWVAVRILPSVHTNPVFVEVDGRPIRANRRSAEWCRRAVDVCWESKQGLIHPDEQADAAEAYEAARAYYDRVIGESP